MHRYDKLLGFVLVEDRKGGLVQDLFVTVNVLLQQIRKRDRKQPGYSLFLRSVAIACSCLLYTSDAADEEDS
eukprot:324112-Amorphochlora_amoeboformis.AAC.1